MTLTLSEKEIVRAYQGEDIVYPTPIRDGLILWYDFKGRTNQDINRGVAVDLSGNGNDGELQNFAYTEGSGYGDGLDFDGVDDLVIVSESVPSVMQEKTLELWIKMHSEPKDGTIVFFYGCNGNDDSLVVGLSGEYGKILATSTSSNDYSKFASVQTHYQWFEWMQLVVTKEANQIKDIYINGINSTEPSTTGFGHRYTNQLILGARIRNGYESFAQARYGSVKLYSRILTDEEITYNYKIERRRWGL